MVHHNAGLLDAGRYGRDMNQRQSAPIGRWMPLLIFFAVFFGACGSTAAEDTATESATTADSVAEDTAEETAEEGSEDEAPEADADEAGEAEEVVTEEEQDPEEDDEAAVADAAEDELAVLVGEMEAVLVDWQTRGGMPAVSMSIRLPGEDVINIASGVTDLTTETPVTEESFFRIGSVTKPMTAALVLQLVEEGLIELDEPVQTYVPGWLDGYQYASEITIRQLLNHTNGLIEYALDPGFYVETSSRLDQEFTPEEIVEFLARQEPLFAPGESYSYETGGFLTLGTVIEAVTGNSAAAEMRARIFEPAGAQNIYLAPEESPPESVVNGYGRGQMYIAGTALIGQEDQLGLTINEEPVVDFMTLPQEAIASAGWTGGGNEAQLESVSAIMQALFDGTILTDAQIEAMVAPTLDETYGFGIRQEDFDGVRVFSHGGGVPGFRSYGAYLPDHDVAWALSTNLIPLPEGATLADLGAEMTPLLVEAAS